MTAPHLRAFITSTSSARLSLAGPDVLLEQGPRVIEINRKGNPPDQVIGHAQYGGGYWILPTDDKPGHPDWSEYLSCKPNCCQQKSPFGNSGYFQIEDPIQPDHHPQAFKDLRVVL